MNKREDSLAILEIVQQLVDSFETRVQWKECVVDIIQCTLTPSKKISSLLNPILEKHHWKPFVSVRPKTSSSRRWKVLKRIQASCYTLRLLGKISHENYKGRRKLCQSNKPESSKMPERQKKAKENKLLTFEIFVHVPHGLDDESLPIRCRFLFRPRHVKVALHCSNLLLERSDALHISAVAQNFRSRRWPQLPLLQSRRSCCTFSGHLNHRRTTVRKLKSTVLPNAR